ncbi:MAG: NAD-dependent epimerase/dehydratase family protein [Clostridia bacterium]|nr:NAD-dependent epimerase/dehydratase family protein [Clostridia bacterium]
MDKVLFIGGPGNISTTTATSLMENGYKLGIFTLPGSPDDDGITGSIKMYYGNRNNPGEMEAAFNDFKPDMVIDFSCFTPEQGEQVLKMVYGRIRRFIFISTVDVYGYPLSHLPMRENDPWNPPNCKYASDKRKCEDIFWARFDRDKFALTVIRPSYSMGNRFVLTALTRNGGKYLIPRLRAGMPILVPGDGTTLIHAGVAYNTGKMVARVAMNDNCIGKSYTCAHDTFMTNDDYIKVFANVLGVEANIVHIPTDILNGMNSEIVASSILNDLTRYNIAFSVEAFKADFPDFIWEKSLEQAAREYIDWNDRMGNFPDISVETYEDRIIKAWLEITRGFKVSAEGVDFVP